MADIPSESSLENTLALFRDPYRFISKRAVAHSSDIFTARIFLRRTICMTGPDAAQLLCDNDRFERKNATPLPIQKTLTGKGGVLSLDGLAHDHRKQMFLDILSPARVRDLVDRAAIEFERAFQQWALEKEITFYSSSHPVLCRAVCDWAGVPLDDSKLKRRTRQLAALFDKAASLGPKHIWSRISRRRSQRWLRRVIRQIRNGQLTPPDDSAAAIISRFRDQDGKLLSKRIAAVELLNILRPVIAVSVFLTHSIHALYLHPECAQRISDSDAYLTAFVQEVRRYYPFFPALSAKVKRDFQWGGFDFKQGTPVLMDVYGTNRDRRTWSTPDKFMPERFLSKELTPFNFIPQGPGDMRTNHRCPGEPLAIELMKMFVKMYVAKTHVDVPQQDLEIDFARLPALPRDRMVLRFANAAANKQI